MYEGLQHTNVQEPSNVTSLGRSNYYVPFIDDSTRKVWVYFLNNKFDEFDAFKKWKAMIKNETNLKVKCLKSDNGEEYLDNDFKRYCTKNGIKMTKTIIRKPQQNGVAERMSKTLNERARRIMIHSGLPKTFLADTVNTVAYLINRGPSIPLNCRILKEVQSRKR